MSDICPHDSLRRSCEVCLRDEEIAALHDQIVDMAERSAALCTKAADEIDRLTAERDALRADALRWRHFIGKRFVMGSGIVLMEAHRTADKSELLYWIDTQMKAQPAAEKTDV